MTIALASTKVRLGWIQCADCKGWFDPSEDAYATVADGLDEKTVCVNCIELRGEVICADCGEVSHADDCVVETFFKRRWGRRGWTEKIRIYRCEDCAEDAGWARCAGCNKWVAPNEQCNSPEDDIYCDGCFYENFAGCEACGELFDRGEMVVCNDELYCADCADCAPGYSEGEDFDPSGFKRGVGCTTKIGSERCYGVELETDSCADYDELADHGAWGAKCDPTCNGKEFYSDILDGDAGLAAIAAIAELAEDNGWRADSNSGYHLHLDARNESDDSLFAAAYAYRITQELWHSFVDSARAGNTYCHRACWDLDDLSPHADSFNSFICNHTTDRYEWMNLRAYHSHTTFEVRLHHGTCDGEEICNWVKAHTRFMDWATTTGLDGVREALGGMNNVDLFNFIAEKVWKDDALRDYYAKRSVFMRHEASVAWVA